MTLQLPDGNIVPRRVPNDEENWLRAQFEEHRKAFESLQRNIDQIAMQFPIQEKNLAAMPFLSSLPASPPDGMRVLYRPGLGLVWDLVFDEEMHNSDGRGWIVLGARPLDTYTASQSQTGSTTWASAGLSLLIPRDGLWDVAFGARMYGDQVGVEPQMSVSGAGLSDGGIILRPVDSFASHVASHAWVERAAALTAGTLFERVRRGTTAGVAYFEYRVLRARPIRLAS